MSAPTRPTKINLTTPFQLWQLESNASARVWDFFVTASGDFTASGAILNDVTISGGFLTDVTFVASSIDLTGFNGSRLTNPTISGGTELSTSVSGVNVDDVVFDPGPFPFADGVHTLNNVRIVNPTVTTQEPIDPDASGLPPPPLTTSGFIRGSHTFDRFLLGEWNNQTVIDSTISGGIIGDIIGVPIAFVPATISGATVNGGELTNTTFMGRFVTVSGGTLQSNTIENPTLSGGTVQANNTTINDATFGNLPTAPTTTPTQSGELVTKAYADSITEAITLGTADAAIPAGTPVGITAEGKVKAAGLHGRSQYALLASAGLTGESTQTWPEITKLDDENYVVIWSAGGADTRLLHFTYSGDSDSYYTGNDITLSGFSESRTTVVRDENNGEERVVVFAHNSSTLLKQWAFGMSGGSFQKIDGPDILYSGVGNPVGIIDRNPGVPDVVGCFIRKNGPKVKYYSARLNNDSLTTFSGVDYTADLESSGPWKPYKNRFRYMRYSEDGDYLQVLFPAPGAYSFAMTASKLSGCPASGVIDNYNVPESHDPINNLLFDDQTCKVQWSVGNTVRMLTKGNSSEHLVNLLEFYMLPSVDEQDSFLTMRAFNYAYTAGTFGENVWRANRINDETLVWYTETLNANSDNDIGAQVCHWPLTGEPSIFASTKLDSDETTSSGIIGVFDSVANQFILGYTQTNIPNNEINVRMYDLIYPVGVTTSVLTSGQPVTTNDIQFEVGSSSETLIPGGPVYVGMSGDNKSKAVSYRGLQDNERDEAIRFGRAITDTLYNIEQP